MPYFTLHKSRELSSLVEKLKDATYTSIAALQTSAYVTKEPIAFYDRLNGEYKSIEPGQRWGNLFDCAWFHFTGTIPPEFDGQQLVLLIDVNGEACVFDESGCPVQGLTNINSEYDYSLGKPGKRVVPLQNASKGHQEVDIWADAGCNDLFGQYRENGTLKEASIAVCHPNLKVLSYDFEVLHELMLQMPETSARRHRIWTALTDSALVLQHMTDDEAATARKILAPELEKRGGDASMAVSAIGHAHIDLGWLWPIRETIRKGARTFSTVLQFMQTYPDYTFGASQAQLYLWMKEYYPDLYEKIRERIKEGRWEVQGGMWVEADTNVSGGEALVRQFLYGKQFFKQEFGIDVTNLWLPDVFGYSGALPQIMAKSGIPFFMTQKLSWSQVNQHPHHSFWWRGIDGSQVLAHMAPEGTYNSSAAPRAIAAAEANYRDKSVSEHCLLIYGIGDGGGGPGEEHIERLQREKNLQGLAPVTQEFAATFFNRLLGESSRFATWNGELYLERHQGTYTTQARNKRFNRKMELALRELELAASKAWWYKHATYPAAELLAIWRETLLYQFHDILPGSSITRVYDESRARYQIMLDQTLELTRIADQALVSELTDGTTPNVIAINSLSWPRSEWIKYRNVWLHIQTPSIGTAQLPLTESVISAGTLTADETRLDNEYFTVLFNHVGQITSLVDKELEHEFVSKGQVLNSLVLYRDTGDAWDMQMHYAEQQPELFVLDHAHALIDGPQAILEFEFSHGASKIQQSVVLTKNSRRIDFVTKVHWQESGYMLRTSFPVAVQADEATYEIQFGNIRRPNHINTSWDMARYEVCAHKWVDISERSWGVSLLNDSKYGHKVIENTIDLDLLRSPSQPDPVADRGDHEFIYSLYPHRGDYVAGKVIQHAYELNTPIRMIDSRESLNQMNDGRSFITVSDPNIIVEAIKKAESGDAIIARMYESTGSSVKTRCRVPDGTQKVVLVDLMENPIRQLDMFESDIEIQFHPFEIHTLCFVRS